MGWSNSKVFVRYMKDTMDRTNAFDIDTDTVKVALFDNTITPDNTVSSANSAYGAGVWASGGVSDATNWVATGRTLASPAITVSTATATFTGTNLAGGGTLSITNAYGCLIYDDTLTTPVADQGICFNYFGSAQTVSSGTFTINWNASGIFAVAC